VFQNNRNKQKTNRNSNKFVKISTFHSPYHKFCLFRLFQYQSKTSKQTETNRNKFFLISRKSKPKNNQNRLSFGLFRFEPRKKLTVSRTPYCRERFLKIFCFFSVCFKIILFVSVVPILIRNTKTNRNKPKKKDFGFAKQTEKQPKQIEFRFVSVRTEKKI
jgi:ATP-dependent Zn protease